MANESWHLSKGIPITFILAILMQTVALIWFVATLSAEVAVNSRDIADLADDESSLENRVQQQDVTLGRIDENIKTIRGILENAGN